MERTIMKKMEIIIQSIFFKIISLYFFQYAKKTFYFEL
jgi:hypothetical protein